MFNNSLDNLSILKKLKETYSDCYLQYDEILNRSSRILMSKTKGTSLYGMFYPDERISKYFVYDGKIVDCVDDCDFLYYFDDKNRLKLTIRKYDNDNEDLIFYYYIDDKIDIVWYSFKRETIFMVGTIERKNDNLYRFLESFDCKKEINSYKEYFFTNEGVVLRTYARDFFKNGKDYESETKFKYIDGA